MDMNHIKNLKYLKSNDIHFYVGWILLILGLVLFVIGELLWLYIIPFQFFISIIFIIIGAVVAFVPSTTRSKDEDLDLAIKVFTDELCKNTVKSLEKKLKNPLEMPMVLGRYLLEGENVIVRKGRKDQKYRSSLYSGAIIAFKKDSIYILQNTLSLISEEKSQITTDILYADNPTARVEECITNVSIKNSASKKEHLLIINDGNNNEIVIPIVNSMIIDEFCERLNKEVQASKKHD